MEHHEHCENNFIKQLTTNEFLNGRSPQMGVDQKHNLKSGMKTV